MPKEYDRAYFDKWYRSRRHRVIDAPSLQRKVSLAVSTAEYYLGRPIRNALDIGCGEGAWLQPLRSLRPRVSYTGLDPSEYASTEFGRTRNIRRASLGDLPSLRLRGEYDLIICSDVLHYVGETEIRDAMWEIARLLEGVAFIEVLTREDPVVGDLEGLIKRPAAWYRKVFRHVGLTQTGAYCWLAPALRNHVASLEIP